MLSKHTLTRIVTFKLSERDFVKLDEYCEQQQISRSNLLRIFVKETLEAEPYQSIVWQEEELVA
jgi:hypothetical protein